MNEERNWAGNFTYHAADWQYPETIAALQSVVRQASTLKVVGSRHSFNDIADTNADALSLSRMPRVFDIDRGRHTVTVDGGVRYGDLCRTLDAEGYALHNLASLPHISVAGAIATGTHGSGDHNGNLATAVVALELVTADGDIVRISREENPDEFAGMVVGLGGLGVVTSVTLTLIPTFQARQEVYENLPYTEIYEHFDEMMSQAYSVSLFTDWYGDYVSQVWIKRVVADNTPFRAQMEWFGATPAPTHRHPIIALSAAACTPQMGIPGPWYERLPHFRMNFTPSSGEELQTEYLVPREHAVAALQSVRGLKYYITPLLQISEVRSMASDDLWMSPCYQQPCVGIHFTWKKDWSAVQRILPLIEDALAPMDARPHWGKLFTMPPERVKSLYPRLHDFQNLLATYDPHGKFGNAFLERYVY